MDYAPSQLPEVDAVELVDLKGLQPNGVSYMRIAKNAPFVRVKGETAQQIAHLWRQLPPDEQARCHLPPFGLRFYAGNKLLVQGSICWHQNSLLTGCHWLSLATKAMRCALQVVCPVAGREPFLEARLVTRFSGLDYQ